MMRKARISLVLAFLALALLATSGRFLVVNQPRQSDVIIVLAGETEHRPARLIQVPMRPFPAVQDKLPRQRLHHRGNLLQTSGESPRGNVQPLGL